MVRHLIAVSILAVLTGSVPAQVAAQAKAVPPKGAAAFVARGASEAVAACANHATNFVKTPGPVKSFTFEDAQLTAGKVDEWNAPFKAGDKDSVAQLVTVRASGEPRAGGNRTYELKCGYNNGKVQGFSFRDVAVPIKTKS